MEKDKRQQEGIQITCIDELTLGLLESASGEKLSTYEIAKQLKISWSTANIHCLSLYSKRKIKNQEQKAERGEGKKMLWWC